MFSAAPAPACGRFLSRPAHSVQLSRCAMGRDFKHNWNLEMCSDTLKIPQGSSLRFRITTNHGFLRWKPLRPAERQPFRAPNQATSRGATVLGYIFVPSFSQHPCCAFCHPLADVPAQNWKPDMRSQDLLERAFGSQVRHQENVSESSAFSNE